MSPAIHLYITVLILVCVDGMVEQGILVRWPCLVGFRLHIQTQHSLSRQASDEAVVG